MDRKTVKTWAFVNRGEDISSHTFEQIDAEVPTDPKAIELGRRMREYRARHRITLARAAQFFGVSVADYSAYERGLTLGVDITPVRVEQFFWAAIEGVI